MKRILSILTVLVFISCSKSDDDQPLISGGDLLTATIDGRSFAALDESVQASQSNATSAFIFAIGGSFVTSNPGIATSEGIGLAFIYNSETDLAVGEQWSFPNQDLNRVAVGSYFVGDANLSGANGALASSNFEGGSATIRITALDKGTKTISGEFRFVALDDDSGISYEVTNGKFNNVSYELN